MVRAGLLWTVCWRHPWLLLFCCELFEELSELPDDESLNDESLLAGCSVKVTVDPLSTFLLPASGSLLCTVSVP